MYCSTLSVDVPSSRARDKVHVVLNGLCMCVNGVDMCSFIVPSPLMTSHLLTSSALCRLISVYSGASL